MNKTVELPSQIINGKSRKSLHSMEVLLERGRIYKKFINIEVNKPFIINSKDHEDVQHYGTLICMMTCDASSNFSISLYNLQGEFIQYLENPILDIEPTSFLNPLETKVFMTKLLLSKFNVINDKNYIVYSEEYIEQHLEELTDYSGEKFIYEGVLYNKTFTIENKEYTLKSIEKLRETGEKITKGSNVTKTTNFNLPLEEPFLVNKNDYPDNDPLIGVVTSKNTDKFILHLLSPKGNVTRLADGLNTAFSYPELLTTFYTSYSVISTDDAHTFVDSGVQDTPEEQLEVTDNIRAMLEDGEIIHKKNNYEVPLNMNIMINSIYNKGITSNKTVVCTFINNYTHVKISDIHGKELFTIQIVDNLDAISLSVLQKASIKFLQSVKIVRSVSDIKGYSVSEQFDDFMLPRYLDSNHMRQKYNLFPEHTVRSMLINGSEALLHDRLRKDTPFLINLGYIDETAICMLVGDDQFKLLEVFNMYGQSIEELTISSEISSFDYIERAIVANRSRIKY